MIRNRFFKFRIASIALLTPIAISLPAAANAASTSGTLNVSATVTANCTISTSALAFGNVNTISGSNVDGAGAIIVTCTNGTAWTAAAGVGSGSGASFSARNMTGGANLLSYNLFTDGARTSVWGDGTGSTAALASTGTGAAQNIPVYGRIASGQTAVPAGSYADTVSVTVTY